MSLFWDHRGVDQRGVDRNIANPSIANPSIASQLDVQDTNDGVPEPFIDVEETARIQLQHSPYRALRRVTCEYFNGTLILRGCVATYHYKQLAQVSVTEIAGVQRIVNVIDVEATLRSEPDRG